MIQEVARIYDNETADQEQAGEAIKTREVWCYRVKLDRGDPPSLALTSDEIPAVGDSQTDGSGSTSNDMTCVSRNVRRVPESLYVDVMVNWASIQVDNESGIFNKEISVTSLVFTEVEGKDLDDQEIVNSAGAPFDPPLEVTYYDEQITISYEAESIDTTSIDGCRGKTNTDSVTISIAGVTRTCEPYTLILTAADWKKSNQDIAFQVTLQLHYRKPRAAPFDKPFKYKLVLDQGYYSNDEGAISMFHDDNKDTMNVQRKLDGGGKLLPEGDDPILLEFKLIEWTSFSGLFAGLSD